MFPPDATNIDDWDVSGFTALLLEMHVRTLYAWKDLYFLHIPHRRIRTLFLYVVGLHICIKAKNFLKKIKKNMSSDHPFC